MSTNSVFGPEFLRELESEATATRKCLAKVPEDRFGWKPHPKSMYLGYLAVLVAEIPKWIYTMVEKSEIDFATFQHSQAKNATELVSHFEENLKAAKAALQNVSDDTLAQPFYLKSHGQVVFTSPKKESISSSKHSARQLLPPSGSLRSD